MGGLCFLDPTMMHSYRSQSNKASSYGADISETFPLYKESQVFCYSSGERARQVLHAN